MFQNNDPDNIMSGYVLPLASNTAAAAAFAQTLWLNNGADFF